MTTLALGTDHPRSIDDLPSPPGLPLLGHAHLFKPGRAHEPLERWARELGTPYRIAIGRRPVVVFTDPAVAHELLRDRPDGMSRSGNLRPVFAEMGIDGLFSTEGRDWLPQRKLIMQSLNATHFRGYFPTLRGITERLYRRWCAAADRGEVLEMTDELTRYTVDVTSALAFGEDPNTLEKDGDIIQRHLALVFPMAMKRTLAPFPYWRHFKLPADRRLDRALAVVHAYAHERIASARERLAADPTRTPRNALEAMLVQRDDQGGVFDDRSIVANVLTLLLAGEDTTAHSLAWTMMFLAQRPEMQAQLHAQALQALGETAVCDSLDGLRELDAFEALAMEATRLRPVVTFFGLETLRERVIGGVHLPRRTRVFLLVRPAQTSARHFDAPDDFRPERWHRGEALAGTHDVRAHLQFGTGPRVCPGRHLAVVEMRLVLSMLLRHFTVELACDAARIREELHFTLKPDRMPIRLRRRTPVGSAPTVANRAGARPATRPATGRCPMGHGQ